MLRTHQPSALWLYGSLLTVSQSNQGKFLVFWALRESPHPPLASTALESAQWHYFLNTFVQLHMWNKLVATSTTHMLFAPLGVLHKLLMVSSGWMQLLFPPLLCYKTWATLQIKTSRDAHFYVLLLALMRIFSPGFLWSKLGSNPSSRSTLVPQFLFRQWQRSKPQTLHQRSTHPLSKGWALLWVTSTYPPDQGGESCHGEEAKLQTHGYASAYGQFIPGCHLAFCISTEEIMNNIERQDWGRAINAASCTS